MQEPSPATVLGDFSGAAFRKDGVTTTFTRQGERFVIRTEGPDRKLADFEVKYVFGVTPLQQYLLALPGGRLQVFTVAWDSRPKAQGGQRWFDLYPKEKLRPGDELHWTGRQNNWNFMCAEACARERRCEARAGAGARPERPARRGASGTRTRGAACARERALRLCARGGAPRRRTQSRRQASARGRATPAPREPRHPERADGLRDRGRRRIGGGQVARQARGA